MTINAEQLHQEAIVIDGTCPLWLGLAAAPPKYIDLCRKGGYTGVVATVSGWNDAPRTTRDIGFWLRYIRETEDVVLIRRAQDILDAKKNGKLGIIFQFQGTEPLEDSLDLVDTYKELGVGLIQLAYNVANRFCDGSEEDRNGGLSRLGRRLVKRMNEARVIVDVSHCGVRTSLEAIEASERTAIFSHANVKAVLDIPRNISDEQIKACAAQGGVIGVLAYPPFVADKKQPDIDDFINHIDHIANLVGIDHVGISLDYFHWQTPFCSDEEQEAMWKQQVEKGAWDPRYYTAPPWRYPTGIATPDELGNLTRRLLERGYKPDDVKKIMGGNWVRVYRDVWGA